MDDEAHVRGKESARPLDTQPQASLQAPSMPLELTAPCYSSGNTIGIGMYLGEQHGIWDISDSLLFFRRLRDVEDDPPEIRSTSEHVSTLACPRTTSPMYVPSSVVQKTTVVSTRMIQVGTTQGQRE